MFKQIQLEEIEQYIPLTKKEGMAGFSKKAEYFGIYVDQILVGFTSIQYYSERAKFNNHFIFEAYRGCGYFKKALDFSLVAAKERSVKEVFATCTEMSLKEYLKRGAVITKRFKKYTAVKLTL